MKRISTLLLIAFILFSGAISAQNNKLQILNDKQVAKLDLNGKWTGKRNQYSNDKKTFIETFEYEFELKQEGDKITGVSTIISKNGNYADMTLEGIIIGNKIHFAEKEVKGVAREEGKVWCLKMGELNVVKDGDNIKLMGATPSFMETYNYPCSGGETDLVKVDNSINLSALANTTNANTTGSEATMNITIFPNPFVENVTINYNLIKVKVEVYDITGKLVTNLFEGSQKQGNYNVNFTAKNNSTLNGLYIVKMTVNSEIFSRQLVQIR